MRIQIVNPSGEVIHTKQGLKLESDIPDHKTFPWWRFIVRHRRKVLLRDLVEVLTALREQTIRV